MLTRFVYALSVAAALVLSQATLAFSQSAAPQTASAPRYGRAVRSPEVHTDGRITFRFRAPGAKRVVLARSGAVPAPMSLDESGVWSLTTEPLEPDFYAYYFVVDGVALADPANPLATAKAVGGHESIAHVPGPASLSWEARDIPHGVLHRHEYHSAAVGESREFWVYTPPDYDSASPKRYPTLYLLHGVMEDSSAWITSGRANVILDNLIERGLARPMVLVFPLGYGFANAPDRVGDLLTGTANQQQVMDVFARSLVDEIVPLVERAYRVEAGRESRALAGLSMGGSQAVYIGLNRHDRFAWVGSFSPATVMFGSRYEALFPAVGPETNSRFRLLWFSVGREDFLLGPNRHFTKWLTTKGVRFAGRETPGGHTWTVWRRNLADFAPLLFRSASAAEDRSAKNFVAPAP